MRIQGNKYINADFSENHDLKNINCRNNRLIELNLFGCTALTSLDCSHNQLTMLDINSCTQLMYMDAHDNELSRHTVDNILSKLVAGKRAGGTCNLALNSSPSSRGIGYKKILLSRGWNVTTASIWSNVKCLIADIVFASGQLETKRERRYDYI